MVFSIVIPAYNRAAFIEKTVNSVLEQSFKDWELIIVNDASTDNTLEVLSLFTDPRIKVVSNEVNLERSASRNKGIKIANGEYVCLLDSDDYFLPDHLQVLHEAIKSSEEKVGFFFTDTEQLFMKDGSVQPVHRFTSDNPVESVIACHVPVITVAIHREIFRNFLFDPLMRINEDVYLFAQIATRYPLYHAPVTTVVWVIHEDNTMGKEKDYLTPQVHATRKIFSDPLIKPFLSKRFKKNKYLDLYSNLIYMHTQRKQRGMALEYFFKAIFCDPLNVKNRSNFLTIFYSLPGGSSVKKIMHKIKY